MPVSFLSADQVAPYVQLNDDDRAWIARKRPDSSRLGHALQLATACFWAPSRKVPHERGLWRRPALAALLPPARTARQPLPLRFARPSSTHYNQGHGSSSRRGYKYLFSHADLVRELLEVFAPPGVSELLDYGTLRPETGNFITPAMKKREDDVVWSIELRGQRIYLYLLLEFQSSIDKGMPVRMMQYLAALYDHLLRSKTVDPADGLPPVLPMVIYNGDTRWKHSPEVFDLIQPHPAVLTEFQPKLKFWLLDEGRFSADYLEGLQRVMAAIFRMEHTHDTDDAKRAIRYLGQAVAQSPFKQTIDRAVMQWMQYRLSRKMPGLPLPQLDDMLKGTEMLETNIDQWRAKAVAEGMQIGALEGEARALQRLLSQRFGAIPMAIVEQIAAADLAQLEAWFDTAISAPNIASVFTATQN